MCIVAIMGKKCMHARIMSQFVYKLLLFLAMGSVFKEGLDPWIGRGFEKGLDQDLDQASEPWVKQGLGAMAGAGL